VIIGKSFKFCAAHFIPDHPKCGEIHGHDYTVTIELQGEVNESGMVVDFTKLSYEMGIILGKMDHQFLNKILPIPTCENLCLFIYDKIKSIGEIEESIYSVTVQEGSGGYARLLCE
jgi:6-pyruvoyltetrahydropterin/6-carboxytetrahydropterin synthase